VAAYIIQAALLAPALVRMGVPTLAAHMFCFYFSILSNITPPVALAAYAAGAVAGADPFKTGVQAVKLGIAAYIVPYMIIFGPALILQGTTMEIIVAVITSIIGIYGLAMFSIGHFKIKLTLIERALFGLASIALISADMMWDVIGISFIVIGMLLHLHRSNRMEQTITPQT
jgi:TRAP-type uncharacterized transport system fused permease subunit